MTLAEKITRAKTDYDDVFDAGYEKGKAEGGGGENTGGGEVRVTTGEITIATNTTTPNTDAVIEHGLGVTPDFIYWITDDVEGYLASGEQGTAGGYWFNPDIPLNKNGFRYVTAPLIPDFSNKILSTSLQYTNIAGRYPNPNETTFTLWNMNNTNKLKAGTYKWYAVKVF